MAGQGRLRVVVRSSELRLDVWLENGGWGEMFSKKGLWGIVIYVETTEFSFRLNCFFTESIDFRSLEDMVDRHVP